MFVNCSTNKLYEYEKEFIFIASLDNAIMH